MFANYYLQNQPKMDGIVRSHFNSITVPGYFSLATISACTFSYTNTNFIVPSSLSLAPHFIVSFVVFSILAILVSGHFRALFKHTQTFLAMNKYYFQFALFSLSLSLHCVTTSRHLTVKRTQTLFNYLVKEKSCREMEDFNLLLFFLTGCTIIMMRECT